MSGPSKTDSRDRLQAFMDKQQKRFARSIDAVFESGDVDAVHEVRVASRRLNEPLELVCSYLDRKRVRRTLRLLRKARRAMRILRELDVILATFCSSRRVGQLLPPGDQAQLEGILTQQRVKALARARRRCRRIDPHMAIQSVSDLTGRTRRSVPQDVAAMAAERFGRRARQLLSTDPSRSNLHQVRLRAKRLRYSAELLRDVGGPNESRLLDALVRFQDLLGEWNDHLCAVRRVSAVARQNRRLALQGDFCGRLLAYASGMTEAAEQQRATIIEQWPGLEAVIHSALNGGADAAVPEPSAAFDAQDA